MERNELEGTLHTMSIAEVLQWAAVAKKTGALVVTTGVGKKTIFFEEGRVIYATSAQKSEKIGSFLIRSKKLDRAKTTRLRELQRSTKKSYDGLALENKFLTQDQIRQAVDALVEAVFQMLVVETEGSFHFVDAKPPPLGAVSTSIRIDDLLARGLRIRQEWNQIAPRIPHPDTRLKTETDLPEEFLAGLKKREKRLLELMDGSNSTMEIRMQSPLTEFETCRCLASWIQQEILGDPGQAQATLRSMDEQILELSQRIDQGEHFEALAELNRILAQRPGYPMAVFQRDRAQRALDKDVNQSIPGLELVPLRVADLASRKGQGLSLDSREGYVLSRVDDRSSLKQIAQLCGLTGPQVKRIIYKLYRYELVQLKRDQTKPSRPTDTRSEPVKQKPSAPVVVPEEKRSSSSSEGEPAQTNLKYSLAELNKLYSDYNRMNHYEKLEVSRSSTKQEIREAYGRLSMRYHPDRYFKEIDQLDPKVVERLEELFGQIYNAYQTLNSPQGRGRYDQQLAQSKDRFDLGQDIMYEDFLKAFSQPIQEKKPKTGTETEPEPPVEDSPSPDEPMPLQEDFLPPREESEPASTPPSRPQSRDRREIARFHFNAAQKLFEEKRYREVAQEMTEAVRRDARQHEYYALLAEAQLKLGKNLQEAVDNTKRAIMLQKEHPPYYVLLSQIYRTMEDLISAERYMKIAVAWDPYNKEASAELKEIREEKNSSIFTRLFRKRKSK